MPPRTQALLPGLFKLMSFTDDSSTFVVIHLQQQQPSVYKNLCIVVLIILVVMLCLLGVLMYLVVQDITNQPLGEEDTDNTPNVAAPQAEHPEVSPLTNCACLRRSNTKQTQQSCLTTAVDNTRNVAAEGLWMDSPDTEKTHTHLEEKFACKLWKIEEEVHECSVTNQTDPAEHTDVKSCGSQVSTDATNGGLVITERKRTHSFGLDSTDPDVRPLERTLSGRSRDRDLSAEHVVPRKLSESTPHTVGSTSRDNSEPKERDFPAPRSSRRVKSFGTTAKLFCLEQTPPAV